MHPLIFIALGILNLFVAFISPEVDAITYFNYVVGIVSIVYGGTKWLYADGRY